MSTGRALFSRWIVSHALGISGVSVLVWVLLNSLAQLWALVLVGPLLGAALGILQSFCLQHYGLRLRGWAPATVIGVIVGFLLSAIVAVGLTLLLVILDERINPVGSLMSPIGIFYFTIGWLGLSLLVGAIGAVCIGVAQWFILRTHYGTAYRWVIGHFISGIILGPLLLIAIVGLSSVVGPVWGKVEGAMLRGLIIALVGGAGGILVGSLTGPWLIAILRHPN